MKWLFLIILITMPACVHTGKISPPQATKIPHEIKIHEEILSDSFHWLEERNNPQVVQYLKAENEYTRANLKSVQDLENDIFRELKSHIKEEDISVPVKDGDYFYSLRYKSGEEYPIYLRKKISTSEKEEIILDLPTLSIGYTYFSSTEPKMNFHQNVVAYAIDNQGRRFYTLFFKDLNNGKILKDKIENVTANFVWAQDDENIFYSQQDPITLRNQKIFQYNIRTHMKRLVYHEKDETFSAFVYKSLSNEFIYIISRSSLTSEVHYLNAFHPDGSFKLFAPRQKEHDYFVQDDGQYFYIVTNKNAPNRKLMLTDLRNTNIGAWRDLVPHRPEVFLEDVSVFKNHLAFEERVNGLTQLRITDKRAKNSYSIPFPDESYLAEIGDNREFDSTLLRFRFESMRSPPSIYNIDMNSRSQVLLKTKEVPNYNANNYKTERIFITSRDGAKVPISLFMRKDFQLNGKSPLLIYGYGAYGVSIDPNYDSDVLSLVDRGYVFAKAHVRGGSEMGRDWYNSGRTSHKMNSFYDFIDCTEALVKMQYVDSRRLYAMGASAGGLLVGAVINLRPDLYRSVIAQVPFVDVLNTMLDESIPLTTSEYDEWGNPHLLADFNIIKNYSPYENVKKQGYPNLLVTSALNDSQVQYWEPTKWVAKLRENNTANSLILLRTDLESGHSGASGRFAQLKDTAAEFAFILKTDQYSQ